MSAHLPHPQPFAGALYSEFPTWHVRTRIQLAGQEWTHALRTDSVWAGQGSGAAQCEIQHAGSLGQQSDSGALCRRI